ncbi:MAG: hypothetical protein MI976_26280 [Pseudomonadales bacterium]|nr:hypothetical protein [Pseudomonadales bacterium]
MDFKYQTLVKTSNLGGDTRVKGLTLVELLLILTLVTIVATLFNSNNQLKNQERLVALSISRTNILLDDLYQRFQGRSSWDEVCSLPEDWGDESAVNGFGFQYQFSDAYCDARSLTVFQYAPQAWVGYFQNHLESTRRYTEEDPNIVGIFPDLAEMESRGVYLVGTTLDVYGNGVGGASYVEKLFTFQGERTPVTGTTRVEVVKPICGLGFTPFIKYRSTGICSYYPQNLRTGELNRLNNLLEDAVDAGAIANEGDYRFQTLDYRLRLVEGGVDDPWVVVAETQERWVEEVDGGVDDEGQPIVNYLPRTTWLASDHECGSAAREGAGIDFVYQLMAEQGYSLVLNLLDRGGVSYRFDFLAWEYEISGSRYSPNEIREMSIENFERNILDRRSVAEVYGIDTEDPSLAITLRLKAWVGCR